MSSLTDLETLLKKGDSEAFEDAFEKFQISITEGKLTDDEKRKAYELSCLNAMNNNNMEGFQRHFARVKQYSDGTAANSKTLEDPVSIKVCAVHLMLLLSEYRLGEFHTELETIPRQLLTNELNSIRSRRGKVINDWRL
eukprot:UN02588